MTAFWFTPRLAALLATLILLALPGMAQVRRGPTHPQAPAGVWALIQRAAKEQPQAALKSLAEAQRVALQRGSRASELAVAEAADRLGRARQEAGDLVGSESFHRLALGIRERLCP